MAVFRRVRDEIGRRIELELLKPMKPTTVEK
jgi:hypothetical protein